MLWRSTFLRRKETRQIEQKRKMTRCPHCTSGLLYLTVCHSFERFGRRFFQKCLSDVRIMAYPLVSLRGSYTRSSTAGCTSRRTTMRYNAVCTTHLSETPFVSTRAKLKATKDAARFVCLHISTGVLALRAKGSEKQKEAELLKSLPFDTPFFPRNLARQKRCCTCRTLTKSALSLPLSCSARTLSMQAINLKMPTIRFTLELLERSPV